MWLDREKFLTVVEHAPLVSIDLVVRGENGRVLLGKRTNEPAKGWWFVPGGRIHKNERLEAAYRRISLNELALASCDGRFLGVFEHFYETNFAEKPGAGTHYVVLAYELTPTDLPAQLPADQHGEFKWFDVETLLHTELVHRHTKAYFQH